MKREWILDNYKIEAEIISVGNVRKTWYKNDTLLKSEPSYIKNKYPNELKEIKDTIKNIEITLSAERDRLDRMYMTGRILSIEHFIKYFFNHPLMAFLTRRLIWNFHFEDKVEPLIYYNNSFLNSSGHIVKIDDCIEVSLWHPINSSLDVIEGFRNLVLEFGIVQPFKQAFREVYILTNAEVKTKYYSNRMAGHVLKQHQLNKLAKSRGWSYSMIGNFYDKSNMGVACLKIMDYNIKVCYYLHEILDYNNINEKNIFNYVSSDRVAFFEIKDTNLKRAVELSNIFPIIFSEAMRDIDLFVGVSSVANDFNWQDISDNYREYFQSHSFGNLSEIAKTRKALLEKILPKLGIADACEIKDKFLRVKGKYRNYKIHIGSTNILMEPNDQYLCIVPDVGDTKKAHRVFIPFEGDNGLSILISKAILLFNDDKIKDKTILSQILG